MIMLSWGSRWHAIKGADLIYHWLLNCTLEIANLSAWRLLLGKRNRSDWATFPQSLLGYGI